MNTQVCSLTARRVAPQTTSDAVTRRFYRPELDALRFFAFLAVLVHHGPPGPNYLWVLHAAGGFGLSMFFLLSAYLITELLLREREQTATVAWGLFFVRRALRIWPLYYAALAAAIVVARIPPHNFWVSKTAIALMSFFVANWTSLSPNLGKLVGHLWSISIEEQFYLVWPPIIKFGGKRLACIASIAFVGSAGAWLAVFSRKGWLLWYETPVEFLYFAAGAMIALATRGKAVPGLSSAVRAGLLISGLAMLVITAHFGAVGVRFSPGPTDPTLQFRYGGSAIGCVMVFLAVLGMSNIPRALIYLGKISYGLYVFHMGALQFTMWLISPLKLAQQSTEEMLLVDITGLLFSIFLAHYSYRYFETPFMKLKERFAIIQSRPA